MLFVVSLCCRLVVGFAVCVWLVSCFWGVMSQLVSFGFTRWCVLIVVFCVVVGYSAYLLWLFVVTAVVWVCLLRLVG